MSQPGAKRCSRFVMRVIHGPLCPLFAIMASHVDRVIEDARIASDETVYGLWCHQRMKFFAEVAQICQVSPSPCARGRLSNSLTSCVDSVRRNEAEESAKTCLRSA